MLKPYHVREQSLCPGAPSQPTKSSVATVVLCSSDLEEHDEDGLQLRNSLPQCERLSNSVMLTQLGSLTEHLDDGQTKDLVALIECFPNVFNDVPSVTTVLEHDVNVAGAAPICQHPYRANAAKREVMRKEVKW